MAKNGMSKEEKLIRTLLERVNESSEKLHFALRDPMWFFVEMNAGRWSKIGVKYSASDGAEWAVLELPYVTRTEAEADGSTFDTAYIALTRSDDRWLWTGIFGPDAPAQEGLSGAVGHNVTIRLEDGRTIRGDALFRLDRKDVADRGTDALFVNGTDGNNYLIVSDDVVSCTVGGPADCSEKRLNAFIDKKCRYKDGTAPTLTERVAEYGEQYFFRIFDDFRMIAETAGENITASALAAFIQNGGDE